MSVTCPLITFVLSDRTTFHHSTLCTAGSADCTLLHCPAGNYNLVRENLESCIDVSLEEQKQNKDQYELAWMVAREIGVSDSLAEPVVCTAGKCSATC